LERYKRSLDAFIKYLGEDTDMASITPRKIMAFACARLDQGVRPESVNLDLRHIKAALNRAFRWEVIPKKIYVEMVKTPKRLPRHLTDQEVGQLLDTEKEPLRRRLWEFLLWTGLRRAEALGLRWEQVFYDDPPRIVVIGKGDRQRIVALLPPAVTALGAHQGTGQVFHYQTGSYLSRLFKDTARRACLGDCHLHDLRHTALTRMVSRGLPLKLVQDYAGHSAIATTMNYAKSFQGDTYRLMREAFGFDGNEENPKGQGQDNAEERPKETGRKRGRPNAG
jgi:integrase